MFTSLFQLSRLLPVDTGGLGSRCYQPFGTRVSLCVWGWGEGNKIGHHPSLPPVPPPLQHWCLSKEIYGEDQLLAGLGRTVPGEEGYVNSICSSAWLARKNIELKSSPDPVPGGNVLWEFRLEKTISLWKNHSCK